MVEKVIVTETVNNVIVSAPGPQGLRGRTILNGNGAPANNLGMVGDFYFDSETTRFWGPKSDSNTWSINNSFILDKEISLTVSWELSHVTGPVNGVYSVLLEHDLGFNPNVTVKTSAGDVLETGIDYNNTNTITLTMAQPFSGTAHLS